MKYLKKSMALLLTVMLFCVFSAFTLERAEYTLTVKVGEKKYVLSYPQIDKSRGKLYVKGLDGVVDEMYYDTLKRAQDADIMLKSGGKGQFEITKEKQGRGINKEKTKEEILRAVDCKLSVLEIPYEVILPNITKNDLKKYTFLKGSFTTLYSSSGSERKQNIALASSYLTCKKIEAGEEFSFNTTVGERTEERGYKNAKVILDGKFADGIGGGVCQVSTTLYNALLLSGILPTEWHRHSLNVSYVEAGFDAMVSDYTSDLKFINNTGGWIFIEAIANGSALTVNIYGLKNEYIYERVSVIDNIILPGDDEIVFNKDLPYGQVNVIQRAKNGLKSTSYLKVYKGQKLIKTLTLRTDFYKATRGVKEMGLA